MEHRETQSQPVGPFRKSWVPQRQLSRVKAAATDLHINNRGKAREFQEQQKSDIRLAKDGTDGSREHWKGASKQENQKGIRISVGIECPRELTGFQKVVLQASQPFNKMGLRSDNPVARVGFWFVRVGYRESAFAYAVAAAGVTHSVARACAQGRLISCGCDPAVNRKGMSKSLRESLEKEKLRFLDAINENSILVDDNLKKLRNKQASRWKWGGCSHNMAFGVEFSELFLDTREKGGDIQSQINLHNNHAGRRAVSNNMQVRCKCHGMSGSCQLKTCWKSAPDFRVVGKVLKQQYRRAVLVDQSNFGNGPPMIVYHKPKKRKHAKNVRPPRRIKDKQQQQQQQQKRQLMENQKPQMMPISRANRKMENALFYYQRSPNFCERDQVSDIPGTVGRRCNRTSSGSEGCASMCCGRGYNLIREKRVDRCNCKFHWCCYVECDDCEIEEWISVCN
ncbi:protein Wnt-10b-like [Uranotaenia lowii]|uniref:protein Wnt-10b-like n=1 Tax=Uranotaenia lowii TaxID=190385 RepID=UPI00247AE160|nr:protein Wnt-10b-like [Uranotaenia lowii]